MEIYLVRHTQPETPKGLIYGQTDVHLAESFKTETKAILSKLPVEPDLVFTSPLSRCSTLANKISNHIIEDARLKEVNFGDWEGRYWDDIPKEELDPWMQNFIEVAPPNGETLNQMQQRVMSFWQDLLNQNSSSPAIVVTHSGVIRIILAHLRGLALKDMFQINVDFGEVFLIDEIKNK